MAFNKDGLSMRWKCILAMAAISVFACGVAAEEPLQKQKIAAYHDFFTTMDWIAYDQYGTYGRGDTEQEAIEDCRKEYAMRLRTLGVEEERNMTNTRKNITQPADWWAAFEKEADKAGLSLSEWIGTACKEKLPWSVQIKLSERQPAHRPKKTPPPRSR